MARAAVARERWLMRMAFMGVAFAIAWVKWDASWMFPLRVLMTLIHEFGHGIAGILTGGSIERIEVGRCLGGLCYVSGGWRWVILPAGYLGSMAAGCSIILLASRTRFAKFVSLALGALVILGTLLWVRTQTGFVYGLLVGAGLASTGWWLTQDINELLLNVVGAMNCMASLFGLKYLFVYQGYNDALLFSKEIFPLPPIVWALAWFALSTVALGFTLHLAARPADKS
ncbi:MAG: M50 family metallopeptidase [Elusimicrobia bacterium]|nr:M50 family metallopeptidase [Elusimicrobiota bacterium]